MSLKVKRFLTTVNASNCYLCWCPATGRGAIVDPAEFTAEMKEAIRENGIILEAIYLTHSHYDHNGAVEEVLQEHEVQVVAAESRLKGKRAADGDVLNLGEEKIAVAAVPGHTPDSTAFIGSGLAFVGDALFAAAVGGTTDRARFEEETENVRRKILSLPDCVVLYPGHGPATTVALERTFNPFFY
jgi:hydroxyacylglutathione hydrolase